MANKTNNNKWDINDTKTKSAIGLGLYAVVIIALVIFLRTGANNTNKENQNTTEPIKTIAPQVTVTMDANASEFKKITDNNYEFVYTIVENENTTIYTGKTYNSKMLFSEISNGKTTKYYKLANNYLNTGLNTIESPFKYETFIKIDNILEILKFAEKEDSSNNEIIAKIAVSDLYDAMYPYENYDPFQTSKLNDDKVIFTISDNNVTKIAYDLKNFISYHSNNEITSLQIDLEYSNFGNITDFEIE